MRTPLLLALFLAAACGSGDDDDDGGGGGGDGGAPAADAAPGAGDPDGGGDVDTTAVVLDYRGNTATLDLAYMGYAMSGEDITGLYFELSNMDEPGCPSETSPIPPQLFTVNGYVGDAPGTSTYADGVRVAFFDFDGDLRDEIEPDSATDASITVTALDTTTGVASGTADITFADGTATGPFVATHCDSLDGEVE